MDGAWPRQPGRLRGLAGSLARGRRLRALAATIGATALACTTAEGDLLSVRQAPDAGVTICAPVEGTLARGAEIEVGGLSGSSGSLGAIALVDGTTEFFRLDANGALLERTPIGDGASTGAARLAATSGDAHAVAFQNHAIAGAWRVYVSPLASSAPAIAWDGLAIAGSGGTESIGPELAVREGEVGVAYREDSALAFSRVSGGERVTNTVLEQRLPHPTVRAVAAHAAGFSVLSLRDAPELDHFDAAGAHRSGAPVAADHASIVTRGAELALATARGTSVDIRRLEVDSLAVVDAPATLIRETAPLAIQLVERDGRLGLGWVAAQGVGFGWIEGSTLVGVSTLDGSSFEPRSFRVLATPTGALAIGVRTDATGVEIVAIAFASGECPEGSSP